MENGDERAQDTPSINRRPQREKIEVEELSVTRKLLGCQYPSDSLAYNHHRFTSGEELQYRGPAKQYCEKEIRLHYSDIQPIP